MNTQKMIEYEKELYALSEEAERLVKQMKQTGDEDVRWAIRQKLKPIDRRRLELYELMDALRGE
jgi:hypothetical protein